MALNTYLHALLGPSHIEEAMPLAKLTSRICEDAEAKEPQP